MWDIKSIIKATNAIIPDIFHLNHVGYKGFGEEEEVNRKYLSSEPCGI